MIYLSIAIAIILSGLFSGLTQALLSLNVVELERKANLGDKLAKKVYPIRKKGNLLLCTLLLGNTAVNAAISILLVDVATGIMAGVISTALILIFGEILPQAIIPRHTLLIGAKTAFFTKLFIIILWPIAFPISIILDKILGDELPTIWSKEELKEIIKVHEDSPDVDLDADEERIIIGALSYSQKKVKDIMTPRTVVYCLDKETLLDETKIREIREEGYSRIPVFEDRVDNIVGILHAKDLIGIETSDNLFVKNIYKHGVAIRISEDKKLDETLNKFIKQRVHIAFIYDKFGGFDGIVTLEDVIEEILQKEVYDEGDDVKDPRKEAIDKAKEDLE